MSTPTLVQQFYIGTLGPARGLSASAFVVPMPNNVLSGNAILLWVHLPAGITVTSITDDQSNSWTSAVSSPVGSATGSGGTDTYVFQLASAAANTRVLTVNLSSAANAFTAWLQEWLNIGALVQSKVSHTVTHASIASGSMTPTTGNLVVHGAFDNAGSPGAQSATAVTAWAKGSGFTMLAGDINNSHDTNSWALQMRIADGTTYNPTLVATGGATDTFNSIAMEFAAASSGTAPDPNALRIVKAQQYTNAALTVPGSWTEFFPAVGNLLVGVNCVPSSSVSAFTDSKSNAWQLCHSDGGAPMFVYAGNPTVGDDLKVTFPLTGANGNITVTLYDIVNADTHAPFVQAQTVDSQDVSNLTAANGQPVITPKFKNGIVLVMMGLGQGPATSITTPSGALFICTTYAGETDLDTIDNADGYGHFYHGSDLSTQTWDWVITSIPTNSANSAAVEFRVPQLPNSNLLPNKGMRPAVFKPGLAR